MRRLILCGLALAMAGLLAASPLRASGDGESREMVWVGVSLLSSDGETIEYLIGTIDKKILDEIELGKYSRKFVRLSNLRIEKEKETPKTDAKVQATAMGEGESQRREFLDCADAYDWGVILVRHEDIVSIELKKGDPLEVEPE